LRLHHPIDWSAIPHLPAPLGEARPTFAIKPFADEHFTLSRKAIAEAAAQVPSGGRVQVLGAGRCRDIPVAALADRFAEVVLCDIDRQRLLDGVKSQTDLTRPERVKLDFRDVCGTADAFRAEAVDLLANVDRGQVAIQRLSELMQRTQPKVQPESGVFDFTVCSGVLSQVDYPVWRCAVELLEDRFGKPFDRELVNELRQSQRQMGHRLRLNLIDQLAAQTRPGGRIYLSDTMRVAHLDVSWWSGWKTTGAYTMGLVPELADYLDRRFTIDDRRQWNWVDLEESEKGKGRLWKVQVLSVTRKADAPKLIME